MEIKKKEIQINNNLLLDINEVSSGYNILKKKLEEKIENFNNNDMAKHEGENIRLEKLKEKYIILKILIIIYYSEIIKQITSIFPYN